MKTPKQTIIWTIIIFIGVTLLSMSERADVDGLNQYGFPFRFYIFGYCETSLCTDLGFKPFNLIADIGIIALIVLLAIRLKNKIFGTIVFILTIGALTSCKSHCDCETIDRKAKDGETLYKICKYVVDNKQIAEPANPCEWTIRETKDDTLNGKNIIRVTLTCCYMGDEVIIDKETNEVIGYIPSDK